MKKKPAHRNKYRLQRLRAATIDVVGREAWEIGVRNFRAGCAWIFVLGIINAVGYATMHLNSWSGEAGAGELALQLHHIAATACMTYFVLAAAMDCIELVLLRSKGLQAIMRRLRHSERSECPLQHGHSAR